MTVRIVPIIMTAFLVTFLVLSQPGGGPAMAAVLSCGDVVTTDILLENDLVDCPADGLVIGASGITLDLDGHTVDGNGIGTNTGAGVRNSGHDGVTVKSGSIQEFEYGVLLMTDAQENKVRHLTMTRIERDGLSLLNSHHSDLRAGRRAERAVKGTLRGGGAALRASAVRGRVALKLE